MKARPRFDSRDLWAASVLFLGSSAFLGFLSSFRTPDGLYHDAAYLLNLADQLSQGNGFVTPVLWQLYLAPERLPAPYGGANGPLISTLVAGVYSCFGRSFALAHLPTYLFGCLLAPLTFGLARRLGLDVMRSFGAGAIVMTQPLLVHHSLSVSTNPPYAAFAILFLALVVDRASLRTSVLMGLVWGLAYLTRYEAVLLVVPLVLALFSRRGMKFRHTVVTVVAFLATSSPWLVRNYVVFGSFFHSYATDYFFTLGSLPDGIDVVRKTSPPPEQLTYLFEHFGDFAVGTFRRSMFTARLLIETIPGNAAVLLGCVLATLRCWRRWRRYLPVLGFCAATLAFFVPGHVEPRYLMILVPIVTIMGTVGLTGWRRRYSWSCGRRVEVVLVIAVVALLLGGESYRSFRTIGSTSFRDRASSSRAAAPFFSSLEPWSSTIMASAPEYQAYFHRQFAVSLPLDLEQDLEEILEAYDVDFILLQESEVPALMALPASRRSGMQLAHEGPSVSVFRVDRSSSP